VGVKLGADEMRYIAFFESMTGARVVDCIMNEGGNKITFVVRNGDIGLAIGKGGVKIQKARRIMGKSIEVIQHSEDPVEFIRNVFAPAKVKEISIVDRENKKVALVEVDASDKGLAVGRGGQNIQRARTLAFRHHGINDVSLT
jgi:N utilization substance protein A